MFEEHNAWLVAAIFFVIFLLVNYGFEIYNKRIFRLAEKLVEKFKQSSKNYNFICRLFIRWSLSTVKAYKDGTVPSLFFFPVAVGILRLISRFN